MTVQEPDRPDLKLMLRVVVDLLADVDDEARHGILSSDTLARIGAVRAVVQRFRELHPWESP